MKNKTFKFVLVALAITLCYNYSLVNDPGTAEGNASDQLAMEFAYGEQ